MTIPEPLLPRVMGGMCGFAIRYVSFLYHNRCLDPNYLAWQEMSYPCTFTQATRRHQLPSLTILVVHHLKKAMYQPQTRLDRSLSLLLSPRPLCYGQALLLPKLPCFSYDAAPSPCPPAWLPWPKTRPWPAMSAPKILPNKMWYLGLQVWIMLTLYFVFLHSLYNLSLV
jgi:hypothetical protein